MMGCAFMIFMMIIAGVFGEEIIAASFQQEFRMECLKQHGEIVRGQCKFSPITTATP